MPKSAAPTRPGRGETLPRQGETLELQPHEVVSDFDVALEPARPTLHRSHHRPLGAHPVPLLGAVGGVALLIAIILLAGGTIVAGLVVMMLAVPVLGLFVGGVMREPDAPVAGRSLQLIHRARSFAGFLAVGVRAEGRAGFGLARVRSRQHQLRRELNATMAPLGEAVHSGDRPRAEALDRRATDLERELEQLDDEASRLTGEAREQVASERSTIQPTRTLVSPQADPDAR
jgi:hypothetical protein